MSMIDYDDLKDIEIPVEQKTMVEIMHNSYDEWTRCALVADGNFKPEDIDHYHTVFANKEDCEKYCEWLNNKEKNNE